MKKHTLLLIVLLFLFITTLAQETQKPISIEDQTIKQEIVDSYNKIISANKDMQIAILKAKVRYKIPENWEFDLNTLSFSPPKKEDKKEAKP